MSRPLLTSWWRSRGELIGATRIKTPFVASHGPRAKRAHLPVEAVTSWRAGRPRLVVRTRCNSTLASATPVMEVPDHLDLCDMCVLADLHFGPAVYRLIGHDDTVLYIGCSENLVSRVESHRSQEYWPLVASVSFEEFPTLAKALDVEEALIRALHPPYNVEYTSRSKRPGRRRPRFANASAA